MRIENLELSGTRIVTIFIALITSTKHSQLLLKLGNVENSIPWLFLKYRGSLYRVYKKKVDKSEIALCFAKRLNIRCFFIKRDCFGTYNLE